MTIATPTTEIHTTGHARLLGCAGATGVASVDGVLVVAVLVAVSVGAEGGSGRGLFSFSGMTTSANSGIAASISTASLFMR
ncbi:MAG TPA: hypothetical protein VGQ36_27340 [Thermoanaerobaculia bacterium]|jgi:hypothetical protein|nr:hypothetical protein [Thermoanaerobaculia bacterium]